MDTNAVRVSNSDGGDQKFGIPDISALHEPIAAAQDKVVQQLTEQYTISANSIVVDVYDSMVEDKRIVDLPG